MRGMWVTIVFLAGCTSANETIRGVDAGSVSFDAPVIVTDASPDDAPIVIPIDAAPPPIDAAAPDVFISPACVGTQVAMTPLLAGCPGVVTWQNRATLCASGHVVAPASWWVSLRNGTAPTHEYWTNDYLTYGGSGPNACSAQLTGGSACPAGNPMRVCAGASDAEGNVCTWTGCGWNTNAPTQYLGGCQSATAGTLCAVPPCADGTAEDVFPSGMFGCAGHVAYAARAPLCGAGYHVCTATDWVAKRGTQLPTHDYWTDTDLGYAGTGPNACAASSPGTGATCPAGSPMRVCAGVTDPEGNTCSWTGCGYATNTPDQRFGGCFNDPTAGTLCCAY